MFYGQRKFKCDDQNLMGEVLDNFEMAKPKKTVFGNFRIEGNQLVYSTSEKTTGEIGLEKGQVDEKSKNLWTLVLTYPEKYSTSSGEKLTRDEWKNKPKNHSWGFRVSWQESTSDTIAIKLKDGTILGNSAILSLIGAYSSYGNKNENRKETTIQKLMVSRKYKMLPFNAFTQANLDVTKLNIVERGPASDVKVKVVKSKYDSDKRKNVDVVSYEERHFTGASLVECQSKYFLFDIDREEIKHNIFNPFIVELPRKVKSIADAYDCLMPEVVKKAIAKGLEVKRQGEWFFIPAKVKAPKVRKEDLLLVMAMDNTFSNPTSMLRNIIGDAGYKKLKAKAEKLEANMPKKQALSNGVNRPNNADMCFQKGGKTYVSGLITHQGREHRDLKLTGWYMVVPNTATKSFTVTGNID